MEPWGIVVLIFMFIIFFYLSGGLIVSAIFNHRIFGSRQEEVVHPYSVRFEDYEDLIRTPYEMEFEREKIRGFLYENKKIKEKKAFVILSHGLFGTHLQYLADIELLTSKGYFVLAYDQYGVGLSSGNEQVSLAHGTLVLNAVIRDVKKRNLNQNFEIFLYGHSWGAYCSIAALKKNPTIKKVVARSGPIKPISAGMHLLHIYKPFLATCFCPILPLCMFIVAGRKNTLSSLPGIKKNLHTKVLLIYAENDPLVNKKNSQAIYFLSHPQQNVEVYISQKGHHNSLLTEESVELLAQKKKEWNAILNITDKKERTRAEEEYLSSLTRVQYIQYDENVKTKIVEFLEN